MKNGPQHPWNGDRNNPVPGLFAALLQAGKLRHVVTSFILPWHINTKKINLKPSNPVFRGQTPSPWPGEGHRRGFPRQGGVSAPGGAEGNQGMWESRNASLEPWDLTGSAHPVPGAPGRAGIDRNAFKNSHLGAHGEDESWELRELWNEPQEVRKARDGFAVKLQ